MTRHPLPPFRGHHVILLLQVAPCHVTVRHQPGNATSSSAPNQGVPHHHPPLGGTTPRHPLPPIRGRHVIVLLQVA
ncbi:hypothetical protein Dimus_029261, partial [Dionaea muscipula]